MQSRFAVLDLCSQGRRAHGCSTATSPSFPPVLSSPPQVATESSSSLLRKQLVVCGPCVRLLSVYFTPVLRSLFTPSEFFPCASNS
eukprot:scaffold202102_cov28-Tisochrysis_lutea.AAC.1